MTPLRILVALHRKGAGTALPGALGSRGFHVEATSNPLATWPRAQPGAVDAVLLLPASSDPASPELASLLGLRKQPGGPALLVLTHEPARLEDLLGEAVDDILDLGLDLAPEYLATRVKRALRHRRQLERERAWKKTAHVDGLTGLNNDLAFRKQVKAECERAVRDGQPLGFLKLDIDNFKTFNDTHGYAVGNEVLKKLAAVLRRKLRAYDFPARLGGGADEFVVLLPETGLPGALAIARRLRLGVQGSAVKHAGLSLHFTISVGAASCQPQVQQKMGDFLQAFGRHMTGAEQAMQQAKQRRNRVEAYVDEDPAEAVGPDGGDGRGEAEGPGEAAAG